MAVSHKVKHTLSTESNCSTLKIFTVEKSNHMSMLRSVYRCLYQLYCNSQKLEMPIHVMSIKERCIKEWHTDMCNNIDEPQNCYAEWKKLCTNEYIWNLYGIWKQMILTYNDRKQINSCLKLWWENIILNETEWTLWHNWNTIL